MSERRIATALVPPFRPRPPWLGADLQTVRNYVRRPRTDLSAFAGQRLAFAMADESGDVLAATLNRAPAPGRKPLILLIHGLTGCEDSRYVQASARFWLGRGHAVLRLNLRGAGLSRPTCREQYHAGRSGDLRAVLAGLDPALAADGVVAIGYSLGGNMLLKYLGEEGAAARIVAAATVSAPIDLAATAEAFHRPRNRAYLHYLLSRMKAESLAPAAALGAAERAAIRSARTVREFDDRFVAPRNGFAGADDYYARCMALPYLGAIRVPTLVIHALDDPWIPGASYAGYDWRANPWLTPLLPAQGGHVGFHAADSRVPWHDRAIGAFLARAAGAGEEDGDRALSAWP